MAHHLRDKRMGLTLEGPPRGAAGEGFTEDLLVVAISAEKEEAIMAVVVVIEAVEVAGSGMVQPSTDGVGTMTIGERLRRERDGADETSKPAALRPNCADETACQHKII
jgi:hypothetical protein